MYFVHYHLLVYFLYILDLKGDGYSNKKLFECTHRRVSMTDLKNKQKKTLFVIPMNEFTSINDFVTNRSGKFGPILLDMILFLGITVFSWF